MSTQLWVTADELSQPDVPEAHASAVSASYLLWALSGRKYGGIKQTTERYECPCRCSTRTLAGMVYPGIHQGHIYNVNVGYGSHCGCGVQHKLRLRGTPIHTVYSVIAGGSELDPEDWEIHNDVYLVPAAGSGWSVCSTVETTYSYGVPPPEAGRRAARLLAEELLKSTIDPDSCRLPDRVTSISRQGVSFTVLDPQSFLDEGRLGLYEVDTFLRAVNPDRARMPAKVFAAGTSRGMRVRGAGVGPKIGPNDLVVKRGEEFTKLFLADDLSGPVDFSDFEPRGQITSWGGATVLDLDSYFTPEVGDPAGSVRLTLPPQITYSSALHGGVFDLYAVLDTDVNTVIHLLTSRVYVS